VLEAIGESFDDRYAWPPWADHLPSAEEQLRHVREARRRFEAREDFTLYLFERTGGAFVGGSGLHRIDWSVPRCEIGYWVRASRRVAERAGFALEGVLRRDVRHRDALRDTAVYARIGRGERAGAAPARGPGLTPRPLPHRRRAGGRGPQRLDALRRTLTRARRPSRFDSIGSSRGCRSLAHSRRLLDFRRTTRRTRGEECAPSNA